MELTPSQPAYVQVARQLRDSIYAGVYPAGGMLPSTTAIAASAGIGRDVAQRAFALLEGEGLVRPAPGRGTVVAVRSLWRVIAVWPARDGDAVAGAAAREVAVRGVPEVTGAGAGISRAEMVIEACGAHHAAGVAASVLAMAGTMAATELSVRSG